MPRRRLSTAKKLTFAVVPLLAALLLGELIARVARDPLYFGSFRLLRVDQVKRGYPAMLDPLLGYAPRPGAATDDSRWGTTVTIDAHGFRSNGQPTPEGPRIVAVGDSFTFGDEVHDHESWPAALERELGSPVINGGVFGYSLGQAVLRAERILDAFPAQWLVLAFIENNMFRNECSRRYSPIPYFDAVDGQLVVHPPAEHSAVPPDEQAARELKNWIGYSALADAFLAHTATEWWIGEKQVRALPHGRGVESSLLLIDRIAAYCAARRCRLLVALLGTRAPDGARAVLARAQRHGATVLDQPALLDAARTAGDPDPEAGLFDGHPTPAGNAWVARHVAASIRAAQ
jgi:hypothetical protein